MSKNPKSKVLCTLYSGATMRRQQPFNRSDGSPHEAAWSVNLKGESDNNAMLYLAYALVAVLSTRRGSEKMKNSDADDKSRTDIAEAAAVVERFKLLSCIFLTQRSDLLACLLLDP